MKSKTGETAKITVTLPPEMLEEIDRQAKEEHRSRSGQIQFFLSKAVARRANSQGRADNPAA